MEIVFRGKKMTNLVFQLNSCLNYYVCKTPTLLNVFFLFYPDGGVAKGILRKFQFL